MKSEEFATAQAERGKIIVMGYYSSSAIMGKVVSKRGIAPCICSGGSGHNSAIPKILIDYDEGNSQKRPEFRVETAQGCNYTTLGAKSRQRARELVLRHIFKRD